MDWKIVSGARTLLPMPSFLIGVVSILLSLAVAFIVRMFAEYPPAKQDVLDDADSEASDDSDEVTLVRFASCYTFLYVLTDAYSAPWWALWTEKPPSRRRRQYRSSDM